MQDADSSLARGGATAHRGSRIVPFLLLTFAWSWTIWIRCWLVAGRPDTMHSPVMLVGIYAGSFGPGIAAGVLSAMQGRQAFLIWLRNFGRLRCGWRAYLFALLPLPLLVLLLTWLLGYVPRMDRAHSLPAVAFYLTLFPVSLFNALATIITGAGPLGEEGGWRGYLLPHLTEYLGEVRASLLIGVVWSFWHLPIMALFAEWRAGTSLAFYLPVYTGGVVALAYVFTVVWRLGKGSLVPCIWLHGLVNAVGSVGFEPKIWSSRWPVEVSTIHWLLAFWILAIGMYFVVGRKRQAFVGERQRGT